MTREIPADSSGILIRKNMLSSNMSSALTVTTPQSIPPTQPSVGYFANVHNQEQRRYKSVLLEDPSKTKRSLVNSLDREVPMHPDCEAFSLGNEASKTFNSPGYPGHYTKNISCVRVLTGEKQKQRQLLISPGRLELDAVHKQGCVVGWVNKDLYTR